MGKLVKQKFNSVNGDRKVYSYLVAIPKKVIIESNIDPDKEIKIKVENGKIVLSN